MAQGVIKVTYGANSQEFGNLEGKTVGQVRQDLAEAFNLPEGAKALVQGEEVDDDQTLQKGDHLEFVKPSGSKG